MMPSPEIPLVRLKPGTHFYPWNRVAPAVISSDSSVSSKNSFDHSSATPVTANVDSLPMSPKNFTTSEDMETDSPIREEIREGLCLAEEARSVVEAALSKKTNQDDPFKLSSQNIGTQPSESFIGTATSTRDNIYDSSAQGTVEASSAPVSLPSISTSNRTTSSPTFGSADLLHSLGTPSTSYRMYSFTSSSSDRHNGQGSPLFSDRTIPSNPYTRRLTNGMAQSRYPPLVRVTPNSSAATSTASAEPSSKDQSIALKRGHHRDHIHRYTLSLKILTCHSEEDEQNYQTGTDKFLCYSS
jgi:hypothetical protein